MWRNKHGSLSSRTESWRWRAIVLGLLGIILYLISHLVIERLDYPWSPDAGTIGGGLGAALAISMVAVLVFERLTQESLMSKVNAAVEAIREKSAVLAGAEELGIEDIFTRRGPRRQDFEYRVKQVLEEQLLQKEGEILIACVAAPDFLVSGTEVSDLLWRHLGTADCNCRLRVLLLSPQSRYLELRASLEKGHPVKEHIEISNRYLSQLNEKAKGKIEYCFYDALPVAFLICTDKYMMMEAYPLYEVAPEKGPIGGRTPMLLAGKATEIYERWRGHFEYLWKNPSLMKNDRNSKHEHHENRGSP